MLIIYACRHSIIMMSRLYNYFSSIRHSQLISSTHLRGIINESFKFCHSHVKYFCFYLSRKIFINRISIKIFRIFSYMFKIEIFVSKYREKTWLPSTRALLFELFCVCDYEVDHMSKHKMIVSLLKVTNYS